MITESEAMIGPGLRYDVRWVGRCRYENSDKVWGWFIYNDPTQAPSTEVKSRWEQSIKFAYTFWGPTGKTLQFKKHQNNSWEINKLVTKKVNRHYDKITVEEMIKLWPDLFDTINNKFIFHLLANDI